MLQPIIDFEIVLSYKLPRAVFFFAQTSHEEVIAEKTIYPREQALSCQAAFEWTRMRVRSKAAGRDTPKATDQGHSEGN
jgi:hypothetical protein